MLLQISLYSLLPEFLRNRSVFSPTRFRHVDFLCAENAKAPSRDLARVGVGDPDYSRKRYAAVDLRWCFPFAISLSVLLFRLPPPLALSRNLTLAASVLVIAQNFLRLRIAFAWHLSSKSSLSASGGETLSLASPTASSLIHYSSMISGARNCTLLQYFTSCTILLP